VASDPSPAGNTSASPTDAGRGGRAVRLALCLERARDGDLRAVDDMVHELNPLLWRVARAQGLQTEEAADVVQTAWLQLLRRLHEIRSPQALTGWMVSVTRREAWHTNARARMRVDPGTDVVEAIADEGPDVPELLATAERHQVLWRHFQRLSERCRTLLRIVAYVDRPDYSVVAEALEMPRGSIGPTRGRCLAKLREMLLADPAWSGS
jgi:RNA polymerase sigma factor (sigma-70 family)